MQPKHGSRCGPRNPNLTPAGSESDDATWRLAEAKAELFNATSGASPASSAGGGDYHRRGDPMTPLPLTRFGSGSFGGGGGGGSANPTPTGSDQAPSASKSRSVFQNHRPPPVPDRAAAAMDGGGGGGGGSAAGAAGAGARAAGAGGPGAAGAPRNDGAGTTGSTTAPPPPPPPGVATSRPPPPPMGGRPMPAARPPPPPLSPKSNRAPPPDFNRAPPPPPPSLAAAAAASPPAASAAAPAGNASGGGAFGGEDAGRINPFGEPPPLPPQHPQWSVLSAAAEGASPSAATAATAAAPATAAEEREGEEADDADERPTDQEVSEYAQYLGLVPGVDGELLWVAEQALLAPVPEGWRITEDHLGRAFYINADTGESSWEHPFDEDYRDLAERMRGAVSSLSGNPPPKETDVLEMAGYLGIDPAAEPRLLWIAAQSSVAPLPEGWAELEDEQGGVYYYDAVADASTRQHPLDEMFRAVLAAERARPGGAGGTSLCSLANNGADMVRALMRLTAEDGAQEVVYDWVARKRAALEPPVKPPSALLGIRVPRGGGGGDGDGSPRESTRLEGGGDGGGADESTTGEPGGEGESVGGSMPVTPRTPAEGAIKTGRMPLVSRVQGAGVRGGGGGSTGGTPRAGATPRGGVGGIIKKKGAGASGAGAKRGALATIASVFLSPFHFAYWLLSLLRALLVHGILRVPKPPDTSPALRASIR